MAGLSAIENDNGLIALATGGTGGHVFPAEALARELEARGYRLALITDRRGDAFGGTLDRIDLHTISAAAVSGRGILGKFAAGFSLALGYIQASRLLNRLRPLAVVGFGGYPSVPTMLAASRNRRIKSAIHEQNAVLGRANRLLAPRMDRIATSFAETSGLRQSDRNKAVWTGNPVRPAIMQLADTPYSPPRKDDPFQLLVVGGSQGARIFGDVIPAAIALLREDQRSRLRVVQQAREPQVQDVSQHYRRIGIEAEVRSFFGDMPQQLTKAHLVISRAGASTIAELTTTGRPSVLVPYRYAIDDHQTENAARICDSAGAWMMPEPDMNAEILAQRLSDLMDQPHTLASAAAAARRIGTPEATRKLADIVVDLVGGSVTSPNIQKNEEAREAHA